MSFNLATMLHESALAAPDQPLTITASSTLTYRQVDELSGRVASSLLASGLERGETVAVHLPNIAEFVLVYFGILKAGLTMLPLNPLLKAPEIVYHLEDSEARAIITLDVLAGEAMKAVESLPEVTPYVLLSPGNDVLPGRAISAMELLGGEDTGDIVPTDADDTAVLIYTSGTTGRPKGAELTHFQLYMNCTTAGNLFEAEEDDRILAVLPFFHVVGLSSVLNLAVRFGLPISPVIRFDPVEVLDTIARDHVTVFSGVPTMFSALIHQDVGDRDLSSLRVAISGGAAIPGEMMKEFEDKYGVVILEGYGLSETASTATFNRSVEERRVLSIGKPIWGVEVRVVDEDDKRLPAGPDHVGEIVIRGHNVMKGYYNRPVETAEVFRNGWFHTGDLGYEDADGFLFIVDRKKDLVIRGGYNVYPREIEEVLHAHPAVASAAVFGRPDDRLGEEVVAAVVLRAGESVTPDELKDYIKERVAAYKYPREIRVLTELPIGPTGKILKTELRKNW